MSLKTRQPTGKVAYPMLLVEGEEKAGKTYAALALSADPRIGRTFAFDLGEGTVDEYAALGPYEVVDHNGSFSDLLAKVTLATKEPRPDPDRPNVIVIDSMTAVWASIKDSLSLRARSSRNGKKELAADPDAEVTITQNLWNEGKSRWGRLINVLRYWDGIVVFIAHGKETVTIEGGRKTEGYSVDSEKGLTQVVTCWVRMTRPHTATLIGIRKLGAPDIPPKGLRLPDESPLAHVVFDVLGAGVEFGESSAVTPQLENSSASAKQALVELLTARPDPTADASAVWHAVMADPTSKLVTDDEWARLEAAARDLVTA